MTQTNEAQYIVFTPKDESEYDYVRDRLNTVGFFTGLMHSYQEPNQDGDKFLIVFSNKLFNTVQYPLIIDGYEDKGNARLELHIDSKDEFVDHVTGITSALARDPSEDEGKLQKLNVIAFMAKMRQGLEAEI